MHHGRRHGPRDRLDHPRSPRAYVARLRDAEGLIARSSHTATEEEAGSRLDVVVARLAEAPRSAVARAFEHGEITLNGVEAKPSARLDAGDVVEFQVARDVAPVTTEPEDLPLDISYEDDDVLVVVKPAGMTTHPAHSVRSGTLANAIVAHVNAAMPGDPLRPGLVHRLDRDTSGLLVVAKTDAALSTLGKAMMRRRIGREYLGLVHGVPSHPEGTLDGPIARDSTNRLRRAIRTDGKPAVTHYALRETLGERASELRFTLETGRTHQIRVHLASFGHPIVNDPVYGRSDPRYPLPGQALHAWKLAFRHPTTGAELAFVAEPPAAYVATRELLRRP